MEDRKLERASLILRISISESLYSSLSLSLTHTLSPSLSPSLASAGKKRDSVGGNVEREEGGTEGRND
jgi:hypothetical protein